MLQALDATARSQGERGRRARVGLSRAA